MHANSDMTQPPSLGAASPVRPARRRVRWLAVAGVLLVLAVLAYLYLFVSRPVGRGAAGPAVERGAFAVAWTQRPVLLLGIGDSVTAGFGASAGHAYFDRLADSRKDDPADIAGVDLRAVIPNLRTLNLAVSGTTSLQHFEREIPKIPPQPPEVFGIVVMTTGGNDLIHNYGRSVPREGAMYGATAAQAAPWIEAFALRLEAMLSAIEACFPGGCAIFLANIYDPTDGVGDIAAAGLPPWPDGLKLLAEYNRILSAAAAARQNVHLVDLHGTFLGHGIHCTQFWREHYRAKDPHYWYYYNLEDPNDRGYDAIRRLFLNELAVAGPAALRD